MSSVQMVIRSGCLSRCQGCQDLKVLGFKGDKGNKVTRVTRVPRLKGLLRDRVFSRTHLRSSLTPEEGPSCCLFIFTNKFMNTTFMHLSIQLAQIRKFRIRPTFHFLDILGPAVE